MNELSFSFHSTVLQLHIPIQVTLTLSQRFNVNQRRMPTFCLFDAEWSWWTCDEAECWHSNIGQTWLYNWSCCCCCCEAPLGPSSKNICFWLSIIYSKAITKGKQIVVRFGEWHDGLRGRKCTKNRFDDVSADNCEQKIAPIRKSCLLVRVNTTIFTIGRQPRLTARRVTQ